MSLTVENLSFSYEQHEVLHEISFTAQAGELLAILGPNGVGKTTLFKCVMGLERRYTGKILADGVDLSALSPRERAHRVAAIPQAHPLSFRYSAFDMVLMGTSHSLSPFAVPGEKEREMARAAMARVHIEHLAERPFDQLSGGEQQLVFIARAPPASIMGTGCWSSAWPGTSPDSGTRSFSPPTTPSTPCGSRTVPWR